MHDRLIELLDNADATLASAVGFVSPDNLENPARIARRARSRLHYPEDVVVVALVGGTGSGKSSLFNVLLGSDLAGVGGIRPTTSRPLVSVPEELAGRLDAYIAGFGEVARTRHRNLPWICLIDLPDTDSVEVDHRLQVQSLLPMVDVVLWVADVEKYRDDSLHRGFIRPLRAYQSQFLFALNQVDRVPKAEIGDIVADFVKALEDDGISDPQVLAVAANPPLTPPGGIDELRTSLKNLGVGSVLDKMLVDLEQSIVALGDAGGASGLDFERRWGGVRDRAAHEALESDLIGASRHLSDFFADLSGQLWGPVAEAAMALSAHVGEDLRSFLRHVETQAITVTTKSKWFRKVSGAGTPGTGPLVTEAEVVEYLDGLVNADLRPGLKDRAAVVANLASLAVAIAETRGAGDR